MTTRSDDTHDRRQLRTTWTVALGGLVAGVLAAAVTGLAGLPGDFGAVSLLLVVSLGCSLAGAHALVAAFVDDLRGRAVARRRPLVGVGLLVLSGVVMAMALGATAS